MAESSLLRLLILVMYFLCSLSSGQFQTVTCDYNQSSLIVMPGPILIVNITGQQCRGGAIRTLQLCFLEADSNLTQIRYRLITNTTQLSRPPPYTGLIGTVNLCGNLDSLCCSNASFGDFNSILSFQVIAFGFGSVDGQEYLINNFISLQLSVLTTESASLSTPPVHESTSLSRTQFSTFFEDSTRVLSSNRLYIYVGIGVLVSIIVIVLGAIILVLMMYMKIKHKQVVATDGDSSHHSENLLLENDKSSVIMTDNDEEYSSPYNDRILTEANVAYTSAMENLYEECGPPTRKVDYSNIGRLQESHFSSFSDSYHNYY